MRMIARARRDDPGPLYIQSARRAPRGYVTSRRARVRSDQAVIYRLAPGRPRTTAWRQGFRGVTVVHHQGQSTGVEGFSLTSLPVTSLPGLPGQSADDSLFSAAKYRRAPYGPDFTPETLQTPHSRGQYHGHTATREVSNSWGTNVFTEAWRAP